MARIQSSVGLATGIPIQDTVDKLMALQAQPRDALVSRQKTLQAEQTAFTDLTALTLGVQFAIKRFEKPELFAGLKTTSSNTDLLTANASSSAQPGQYRFIPARLASANHALSSGVAAADQSLGGGSLSFHFGGQVNTAVTLGDLNGGEGVSRGQIKITDRSGQTATIDLRYVQTIDDVLTAINSSDSGVTAAVAGDHLVLTDHSGGAGNLRVQDVGSGTTAADLGLATINVAANEAAGQNIVSLFSGMRLDQLRDGNGLTLRTDLPDLRVTFRDGSAPLDVDLNPSSGTQPKTVGDLLSRLNAADPARLKAQISADGKRIELIDLTAGAGTFAVSSPFNGSLAEDLGLTGAAVGGTITGQRLISGLKTTLLGSLGGSQGLGPLGSIQLTDRSGATASINLASAETLDDVISAVNGAGLGITASYNAAGNGLVLTDTTGLTASNLIVANGDATNTATKLGLVANAAVTSANSGNLKRQTVSASTLLSSYNGGQGVAKSSFKITNSAGASATVNLATLKPQTIGDILDAINGLSLGVEARINDEGDGIALVDTAGGSGTLTVSDVGTGRTAADLHLRGSGTATTIDGSPAQLLDGTTTFTVQLDAEDTLADLVSKINDLKVGVNASVFSERAGSLPAHLSLLSSASGRAGQLQIDGTSLGLSFEDLTTGQDALLQIGSAASGAGLVSSATNKFTAVAPGLDVTLADQSLDPVTVTIAQTPDSSSAALQTFVDNYNKLRDKLATYTALDVDHNTKGTLFGSAETLRLDADLSRAISGQYFNDGAIRSLAELGISIDDKGKLSLDKSKLEDRFNADPEAITEFFSDTERGFAVKLDGILESLVGRDNSLLVTRAQALQRQLDDYDSRISIWNARLDRHRDTLLNQFYRLETVVSSIKNNLSAISQIQFIALNQNSSNTSSA